MLATAAALVLVAADAETAVPGVNGAIAFEAAGRVATVEPNGSGLRELRLDGETPAWSPDGRWIAFSRNGEIYATRPAGRPVVRLTDDEYCPDSEPSWSPDGRRIAFTRVVGRAGQIWTLDVRSGLQSLRFRGSPSAAQASWSPDGSTVAVVDRRYFVGERPNGQIALVDERGRVTALTSQSGSSFEPDWAPDGRTIVFEREGDSYAVRSDGSGVRRVHDGRDPAWSPDGRRIAVIGRVAAGNSLWTVAPDGGDARFVAHVGGDPLGLANPAWQPRGRPALAISPRTSRSPAMCQREQRRTVSLRLEGHLRAAGRVSAEKGAVVDCERGAHVAVERQAGRRWLFARRVRTNDRGRFRVSLRDRPGRYRARILVAPRPRPVPVRNRVCLAAVSRVAAHIH